MPNLRKLVAFLLTLASALYVLPGPVAGAADQEPPTLNVMIPRVVNVGWVDITGETEPGASVTVNGVQVTPDEKGKFRTRIRPLPATVIVTATDSTGNQRMVTERVKAGTVPWLVANPLVGITVKAPEGTLVRQYGGEDGVYPDATGLVRWIFGPKLGWNDYVLEFKPPGASPYYHLYSVFKPIEADLPQKTNLSRLEVPARILKGWQLSIDGKPVTTDAEGRFTLAWDLTLGVNERKFRFTPPEGQPLTLTVLVTRVDLANELRFKNGHWQFRAMGEPDLVYGHKGLPRLWMPALGAVYWDIPLVDGLNDVLIHYVAPSGDAGILQYQFEYAPTK